MNDHPLKMKCLLMPTMWHVAGASLVAQTVKNSPANAGDVRDADLIPEWVRKIPWSWKWQPSPVFLPRIIPWTEEPGGLQSMASQSWMRLGDSHTHHVVGPEDLKDSKGE